MTNNNPNIPVTQRPTMPERVQKQANLPSPSRPAPPMPTVKPSKPGK